MSCSLQTCDVPPDDLRANELYPEEKMEHTTNVIHARYLVTTDKHVLTMFHCTNYVLGIIFYGVLIGFEVLVKLCMITNVESFT